MKKNNFVQGAFIATFGIVMTKIIGILYVIPFYQIIGDKGGALYGYAYNIYNIFLNISYAGIPIAMSKIISEYNALGLHEDKKQAFKIGVKTAFILSIASFLILFIFAPFISYLIIGNVDGGNTREEIALVIRVISTAIIIVPVLSIYRGYFQGHKYMKPASVSQIIEQIFRVVVILVGSYLALKVFNLSLTTAVGISVFGATIGALFSFAYILKKYYDNKKEFEDSHNTKRTVSDKAIFKQLIIYSIPLVLIDLSKTLYSSVDVMTLVKTLVNGVGYSVVDAESIMSVISTWGLKLNMIITSIGTGIVLSLVPNLSENYVANEKKEVNNKINKSLQILLFFTLPMTVGLSLLSKPVWSVFYGFNELNSTTFSYSVFIALFLGLFMTGVTTIQIMKDYKYVIVCLVIGIITKLALNIPLIYLFNELRLPAHFGSITATILGYSVPFIISLIHLKNKFDIKYKETLINSIHITVGTFLMAGSIIVIRLFVPNYLSSRIANIGLILGYTIVGLVIYLLYMWKMGLISKMFGNKLKKLKK